MTDPVWRWPAPLKAGDTVFVTAPSAGVREALHPRLDLALQRLTDQGYQVMEGQCLRSSGQGVSAPAAQRAMEWQGALLNPAYQAVLSPWGGERAIELLPHLDFDALRQARPKWVSGFSDLSTLFMPLSLCAGWVTLHGPNLMELAAEPLDATSARLLEAYDLTDCQGWRQGPSLAHCRQPGADIAQFPAAALQPDTPTRWRFLREDMPRKVAGRLMGGCLETVSRIAGTRFAPMGGREEPWLLYLEGAEAGPFELARTLQSLALHGWFDTGSLAGLLIGRSAAALQRTADGFEGWSLLHELLADFRGAVVLDMDIGHVPPQITLANGAWAELCMEPGLESLTQYWGRP